MRQNSLRQRTRRTLVWIAGEVVWIVRCRQRVIGVNDRGLAVLRVDRDLEQVEQVARARTAADPAGADNTHVVRRRVHLSLGEADAIELGEVNMPARARIQIRCRGLTIIDNIDNAVVGRDPREQRRARRRRADNYRGRPGIPLVARARKRDGFCVRVAPVWCWRLWPVALCGSMFP